MNELNALHKILNGSEGMVQPATAPVGLQMKASMKEAQVNIWAPCQYPIRRLFVRSREVSKPRDLYLELSDRSEI